MNELEIVNHRQIDGLSMFINTVDYRTPHVHSEWEVILILNEPLAVTCGQNRFVAEEGQLVLFSPNEPHEFHKLNNSSTFLCLQVSPNLLPISSQLVADEKLPHKCLSAADIRGIKETMCDMMEAYLNRKENHALYCVGMCCLIFHQLLTKLPTHVLTTDEAASVSRRNERLKRLIQFVDENYMHKIRLSDFAEMEGCSMSHLSHFIKDALNQTFQEYVNSVRFYRACELMAAGERKMLDICIESGFSDYRYFSRAFRQQYGMTPEEYYCTLDKRQLESAVVHHSIHSMERFYSREDSLIILKKCID